MPGYDIHQCVVSLSEVSNPKLLQKEETVKKILVLALATALVGGAALAVWNAQDVVPAASLLVPYAVVSSNAAGTATVADGWTTQFAITNVSSEAIIVHITVWSARSNAVVDWDILLTGYDVWNINFKDMLDGNFDLFDTAAGAHATAPTGYSWTPAGWGPVYNKVATPGELQISGTFAAAPGSCIMPYGKQDVFGGIIRTKIRSGQAAAPDLWYECDSDNVFANDKTDLGKLTAADPFFFYVTADVVTNCTKNFQNTSSYWAAASRVNRNVNVIIGDIVYLNQTAHYSEMLNAVHLESLNLGQTLPTGAPFDDMITFYELDMWDVAFTVETPDGVDDREPLGTEYAFRYSTSPSPLQSNVIVWKSQNSLYYDGPDEYTDGCRDYRYWAWNEDELTKSHQGGGPSGSQDILEPCALCFETQKVKVDLNNFTGLVTIATPKVTGAGGAGFGWVWIDFIGNHIGDPEDNPLEAYVAMEFVFGNYATAAAAPLLWTPYNRMNGSAVFGYYPANGPIPTTKPAVEPLAYSFVPSS